MTELVRVDVFVEDRAHEDFLVALVRRLARESKRQVRTVVRSSRGGQGRAIQEMVTVQHTIQHGFFGIPMPDVFVVGIDGNCKTSPVRRREIEERCLAPFKNRLVVACPDPHVERWYMADPASFLGVVGATPRVGHTKCLRDYYVDLLASTVRAGGHPPTLGGIEFAADLVDAMDLRRAERGHPDLAQFVRDFRHPLAARE